MNGKQQTASMTGYLWRFRWAVLLAVLPLLLTCGLQACSSLLVVEVFQSVFEGSMERFLTWILILVGIWFLLILCSTLKELLEGRAIRKLNNALRGDIAAALLRMSYSQYHSAGVGEQLSRFTNDISQIEALAWKPFFQFAGAAATAVFSVLALLTLHWSLVLAALVTTALMLLIPQLFNSRMERLGTLCGVRQAEATARLKDLLSGWDVLRAFSREERFSQGARQASDEIEQPRFRLACVKGIAGGGVGCVNIFCQALIIGLVGLLALWGFTRAGSLAAGGNLCGALSNALGSMAGLRLSFSSAKPYFEKIPVSGKPASQPRLEPVRSSISLEKLSFRYGQKPVLRELSLQFQKGGKYALIGPSGCGKSTLLKLLMGWLEDYEGRILLDDRDARSCTPEQLQQQMSYVEQNVFLFNATIRDNITLGGRFTDAQLQKALQDSALAADLAAMPAGLDTLAGEEGSSLSGGQRQRVAIARALIHRRSILLIDEGTSALDQQNADIVEQSLLGNPELTLILVSHHLTPERKAQFTRVYELESIA